MIECDLNVMLLASDFKFLSVTHQKARLPMKTRNRASGTNKNKMIAFKKRNSINTANTHLT